MEIINFSDYRDFLKLKVDEKKQFAKFSYQSFANKLGVTKSYLKLVVDKQRHISIEKAFPISRFFGLNAFESQYFYFMVLKNSLTDSTDSEFFDSILKSYSAFRRCDYNITPELENSEYFYNWVNMAILSLVGLRDFNLDLEWIHKKLGGELVVSRDEIERSVNFLLVNNFLKKNSQNEKRDLISNVPAWDSLDYRRFHTGLIRTHKALDLKGKTSLHRPNRHHMFVMAMSLENSKKVIAAYDELEKKLIEISTCKQEAEVVMMVSNNVFKISSDN